MWIAIIILTLIALVLLYMLLIKRNKHIIFAKITQGDLESNAKDLAIAMRMPDAVGSSPKIKPLLRVLHIAYNTIKHKVNCADELYNFEKWIYENYYSVIKLINVREYRAFALLPHKNKQTRIIAVAELIVNGSYGEVNQSILDTVINTFNSHTPLHIEEIKALKQAISFALIERLAYVASNVKRYEKMKKLALNKRNINEKFTDSDCYLYWLKMEGKQINHKEIKKSDINIENIEYSFSTSLIDNCIVASNCIKSIKNLKNYFVKGANLEYYYAHTLLLSDKIYVGMDMDSKLMYLNAIDKLAGVFNVSEKMIIESAMALASEHNEHFGRYLFENNILIRAYLLSKKTKKIHISDTKKIQRLYIFAVFLLNTLLSTLLGVLTMNIYVAIIVFVLSELAGLSLVEFIVQKAHKGILTARPVPKLDYDEIPQEHSVMLVMPCYVTSEQQLDEFCNNLLSIRAINSGKNIYFSLLLDYKACDQSISPEDYKWNSVLANKLSQYPDINVFVRRRACINGKYSGFERKRGAIQALNDFLLTDNNREFSYTLNKDVKTPTYICVLDADSKIMPGALRSCVCAMAHPLNASFDIMSFGSSYNMNSISTIFSRQFYFDSGYECYNNYSNYYFNAFNRSIFCGKGIYRLGAFYCKLNNVLPNGKVLSHDIIEGAILNCGALTENVYEDTPENLVSETARNNRWLAGDIQLSTMLNKNIKGADGKKRAIKRHPIYNYLMLTNTLKAFAPIAMLLLVLLGLFSSNIFYALPSIVLLGAKFIMQLLERIAGINKGIRYKYVLYGMLQVTAKAIMDFFMLPFFAVNNLIVAIKQFFKLMFNKKGELKWKTFFETRGGYTFSAYLAMIMPSFIVAIILAVFGHDNLAVLTYVAIFYAIMLSAYPFGVRNDELDTLSDRQTQLLTMYARKTYEFFDINRNENYLICDNFQVKPYKGKSVGTSPTNIAFSLLAEISACEIDIIDKAKAEHNIVEILKAIVSLKKYRGHLYNWYNINTKQIMPPNYVSSVDSGNLLAGLIVTKQFLLKNNLDGVLLCDRLIDGMDFNFLFDKQTALFYIGYNTQTKEFGGHYDLLASEAQILNYILSAKNNGIFSWNSLARVFTSSQGNTLMSWSGTMFEYLMPTLFFRAPIGSLIDSSVKSAIKAQRKHKCNGYFGISESGYYKFDDNLQYQYHAFGDNSLALRAEQNRCVITPYASFLAMQYDKESALNNLYGLYMEDAFGDYGFYESIDFTNGKKIVASYMAHHQGMIITSIANTMRDNVISQLFLSDHAMQGGRLLLTERRPISKMGKVPHDDYVYCQDCNYDELVLDSTPPYPIDVFMLTGGKYRLYINSRGMGTSMSNDICINKQRNNPNSNCGLNIDVTDLATGIIRHPYCHNLDENKNYKITASYEHVELKNIKNCISESIYIPHCINGEVREIRVKNDNSYENNYEIHLNLELSLDKHEDEIVHPLFSDMFVSTQLLADKQAIIYHRKARSKLGDTYAAIVYKGFDMPEITTNRYNAIRGRNDNLQDFGDVLYPCFDLKSTIKIMPNDEFVCSVIIMQSDSLIELNNMITMCLEEHFISYAKKSAEIQSLSKIGKLIKTKRAFSCTSKFASVILYGDYKAVSKEKMRTINFNETMASVGINSNTKCAYYKYSGNNCELKDLYNLLQYINLSGIKVYMLISYKETEQYHAPILSKVKVICNGDNSYVKFIEENSLSQDVIDCCFIDLNNLDKMFCERTISTHNFDISDYEIKHFSGELPKITLPSGSGGYTQNNSYLVNAPTLLPYSNVICCKFGGTIVTENGGVYTYFDNSRQNKFTVWRNDPITDCASEKVLLNDGEQNYQLNMLKQGGAVEHGIGYTNYFTQVDLYLAQTTCYMIEDGKCKIYEVTIINNSASTKNIDISLRIDPCLGVSARYEMLLTSIKDGVATMSRADNNASVHIRAIGGELNTIFNDFSLGATGELFPQLGEDILFSVRLNIAANAKKTIIFAISQDIDVLTNLSMSNIYASKKASFDNFAAINKVKINTNAKHLDAIFNNFLQYQVVSSRLNGRCGYYQAGGAIGFRDQLQDCLSMLYSSPEYVRAHIIECAKRQFREGDVLHWWHEDNRGVRTRISDDKLFLPYLVAEYIQFTSDKSILDEQISYLKGEKLGEGIESRYEQYVSSIKSESLYEHCIAAIDSALSYGEHGLLLIGSGDWNDALNDIGMKGKGESVWLSMFAYDVISNFIQFISIEKRIDYLKTLDNLFSAINKQFVGGYFRRAFTDDGQWLGDSSSPVCKIDLISQAYAVIADIGSGKNKLSAMKAAEKLIDYDKRIIKLLSPSFDKTHYSGYISSYPTGVRENGGQYTHGAAWFIRAVAKLGEREKALDLLELINPSEKCANDDFNQIYMGEPYVFSGDVYKSGQMGWSWYTGSASWIYKIIIEDIIGIKIRGNEMVFNPQYLKKLGESYSVSIKWKTSIYNITFALASKRSVSLNGINYGSTVKNADLKSDSTFKIPLVDNSKTNEVQIDY